MTKSSKSYRYELVHGDDADFIAYQRKSVQGAWRTVSIWMVPQPTFRSR
jgi:hypothetical protein